MVSIARYFARPRIGIEHGDDAFGRTLTAAIRTHDVRHWTPSEGAVLAVDVDIAVVERTACAEKILARSPRVSLLRWGRPQESPDGWTWDGWISRSLDASRAAHVLLELIDSGLLARNHGPAPNPRLTISK